MVQYVPRSFGGTIILNQPVQQQQPSGGAMTTPLVAIRNDNAYVALGKQSAGGTPVAPDHFFRWLDGSGLMPDLKTEELWEGDGSRHLSQVFKSGQKWGIKLVVAPRPDGLAYLLGAAAGHGSDSVTAPSYASTLSNAPAKGASSFNVTATTGLGSSGTIALMIDKGLSTEEVVIAQLPASGSTLTLASGTVFAYGHSIGATVTSVALHAITDQYDGDWYTGEVCIGGLNGGAGATYRIRDMKVVDVKYNLEKGKEFTLEINLMGIACAVQNSPSTVLLENRQIFLFHGAQFTLNGLTTGDALNIFKATLEQKNNTDSDTQTTSINPAAIIFGKYELKVSLDLVMTTLALAALTYLGSTAGTADATAIGTGAFQVILTQPDGFHTMTLAVGMIAYTAAKPPEPKADGKVYTLAVESVATSNMGQLANLLTATIGNAITSAYN